MPELDAKQLKNEAEYQRAFLVLSLISHAYIWGAKGEKVLQVFVFLENIKYLIGIAAQSS